MHNGEDKFLNELVNIYILTVVETSTICTEDRQKDVL